MNINLYEGTTIQNWTGKPNFWSTSKYLTNNGSAKSTTFFRNEMYIMSISPQWHVWLSKHNAKAHNLLCDTGHFNDLKEYLWPFTIRLRHIMIALKVMGKRESCLLRLKKSTNRQSGIVKITSLYLLVFSFLLLHLVLTCFERKKWLTVRIQFFNSIYRTSKFMKRLHLVSESRRKRESRLWKILTCTTSFIPLPCVLQIPNQKGKITTQSTWGKYTVFN